MHWQYWLTESYYRFMVELQVWHFEAFLQEEQVYGQATHATVELLS